MVKVLTTNDGSDWLELVTSQGNVSALPVDPSSLPNLGGLVRTLYVDSANTNPFQDGTQQAPFHSIQGALTHMGVPTSTADADTGYVIWISPSVYVENLVIPAYRNVSLVSEFGQMVTGSLTWHNAAGGGAVPPTSFANVFLNAVGMTGDVTITDDGTVASGFGLFDVGQAVDRNIGGNFDSSGATNFSFLTCTSAYIVGHILCSSADPGGPFVQLADSEVDGDITCKYLFVLAGCSLYGLNFTTTTFCEFFHGTKFYGVSPVIHGGGTSIVSFDLPSRSSFAAQGGTIVAPSAVAVIDLVNSAKGVNSGGALGPAATVSQAASSTLAKKKSGTVAVAAMIAGTASAAGTVTITLLRDATPLFSLPVQTAGVGNAWECTPSGFLDTLPDLAAHTYAVQAAIGGGPTLTVAINNAYVSAIEQ